jgi:hypothetical protein
LDREKLFHDFKALGSKMPRLASIIQNGGIKVSKRELLDWSKDFESYLEELDEMRIEILEYFLEEEQ